MTNEGNLKPVRSKAEARERGRIGGVKSGEARREKKLFKEEISAEVENVIKVELKDD